MSENNSNKTLYVDLDGTLVNSDLLLESFFRLLSRNFLYLFLVPLWLLRGKAELKSRIAARVELNSDLLPYNQKLLAYLETEKRLGRRLVLISASNQILVDAVASSTGLFDQAVGSDESENLKGEKKLARILELSGGRPFDYAGNERADLKIWQQASGAIVVNGSEQLVNAAANLTNIVAAIDCERNRFSDFLKALRIHQWAKNLLLFIPLLLAHRLDNPALVLQSFIAFISFSLCASSVYLLNDLLDLEHDRQHQSKRYRPFAAGELSLLAGLLSVPLLLAVAFLLTLLLPWHFSAVLLGYFLLTLCYSFFLKAIAIVDVLILACLYTTRIIAGAAAISVIPSFWLLAFSMFLFMSLAIAKRVAELDTLRDQKQQQARGRGYHAADLESLSRLGNTSGLIAVLVFALYINAEETQVLYGTPQILWFICPLLLYLISRIWLLTNRGQLHEDPVVFFISDHNSQIVVLLSGLLLWAATGNWL
jgi:4-hydroxybenzoate polyprenyltransferase/phosphoserine phosphatase